MYVSAIIVAAGLSRRLKSKQRKPFLRIGGSSVLEISVSNFERNAFIKDIVVVARENDLSRAGKILSGYKKIKRIIAGGENRSDSVKKGIDAISPLAEAVLIHDAARPLVSSALIERVIKAVERYAAAIPVIKVTSTVKKAKNNFVQGTVDRKNLFLSQTPQAFKVNSLKKAIAAKARGYRKMTDEAFLFESLGRKVRIVEGEVANIKITAKEDFEMARMLYAKRKT